MRMDYEDLKVWRDTFALLVRVSNLSDILQDNEGRIGDFESLRAELVELMTSIYRACEADDTGAAAGHAACAATHAMRAKIWIRVLMETHIISRYIYQQLYTAASSIQKQLREWQEEL